MLDIIGAIKEVFGAARATEEKLKQKEALNNTPQMQQAAQAEDMQKLQDQHKKDLAHENTEAIRRDLAD